MKGSISKRGNRFYIYYYIGKNSEGKWIQKSEGGFLTREDAEARLRLRNEEIQAFDSNYMNCWTVDKLLHYWFQAHCKYALAPNTQRGYLVNIEKHIVPYIGNKLIAKLKPIDIQNLYTKLLNSGLSPTSVHYVHSNLHTALDFAVSIEAIPKNPADRVSAPRPNNTEADFLNMDEVLKLLVSCRRTEIYWPVLLAVSLGLRRGEALGLRWEDLDLTHKLVYIHCSAQAYSAETYTFAKTKSRASRRTLVMSDFLAAELSFRKKELDEARQEFGKSFNALNVVSCRDSGLPLTANVLQHKFKEALMNAGVKTVTFHDLRHTNATLLLRSGIPAKIVSTMLGHSSYQLTMDTYSHVVPEMQEPAAKAMNDFLSQL